MQSYWFSKQSKIKIKYNISVITITITMSIILANFGKYAISDCPFIINVSVATPLSVGSHTSVWCLPAAGGWLVVSCQDWPVDHACRLARGQVGRHGQSQGATYTGGFQDFIVTALTPRPKLKSRGATYTGSATYAGVFTVLFDLVT